MTHVADVVVVGAGPCGAFLANLLGQMGLSCVLLEKRREIERSSMAIGVMPPSLQRLECIGLADLMARSGCQVTHAGVWAESGCLGTLELGILPTPYNYVLSIPQGDLVRILRERLGGWPRVRLLLGMEIQGVSQTETGVNVRTQDVVTGVGADLSARFVVACDGNRSPTRALAGISVHEKVYGTSFMMGDFPETTSWGREARLFFTPTGSIESFPLPQGKRRWVIQTEEATPAAEVIARRVGAVAGVGLDAGQAEWVSCFTPERRLSRGFFKGRVVLCGDAAHVMSPIGGQGMNTGLADAWHLAKVLQRLCASGEYPDRLLDRYEECRRRAFGIAANRAARGMWLGTLKGRRADVMRSVFVRRILFGPLLRARLAPYFAMLTIPDEDPVG
jgi:2-polyprenyl-6-methoxyphenol hydroxylase-like FAD-dependent oxidoreductase